MKKVAFISILVLFLASTTAWACWNCYGDDSSNSYSQTKSVIEIENKYSEQLGKLEESLELTQLEIYKLLDNPKSTVGEVTAKEQEFDSIKSEYLELVDKMKQELADQGIRPRFNRSPNRQYKQAQRGYDCQGRGVRGYGTGNCWQ